MRQNFYTKDILRNHKYYRFFDIGDYTYGNPTVPCWGEGAKLRIGKFCSIAPEVVIFLGGNHRTDWITTYPFTVLKDEWPEAAEISGHPSTKGDVIIGKDVWIGFGATILSGVKIGDGSVIGARSVVTNEIHLYAVVTGNPAKEKKKRFSAAIIEKLLEMGWRD
jgi:acetyltransferase-like isoleucine patch superfamily enzyme